MGDILTSRFLDRHNYDKTQAGAPQSSNCYKEQELTS